MTGTITTCITNQAKMDFMMGGHLIAVTNVQTGNCFASPNNLVNQLTNTFNLAVGMWVNCVNQNAGNVTFIQRIINTTAIEVSQPMGLANQEPMTFRGDSLFMALIKFGPGRSYDRNTTCLANVQLATSDEVSGTGYTANGTILTPAAPGVGVIAADITDSNTAILNFSPNPSWTTATISAAGAIIYNWGAGNVAGQSRLGYISNTTTTTANSSVVNNAIIGTSGGQRAISLHDFGGQQQVTGGTFTVNMPTANGTAAILRIS